MADTVVKMAEDFHKEGSQERLGKERPDRNGRSLITVELSSDKDEGMTWPIDSPKRTLHEVWLTTSVLDSYCYPESLAAWASEGIASQVDDAKRKESRWKVLAAWSKDARWPSVRSLLQSSPMGHDNLNATRPPPRSASSSPSAAGRTGSSSSPEAARSSDGTKPLEILMACGTLPSCKLPGRSG
ncbi:MAG: hypothetical protein ACLP9L_24015 [Thermoguttaceae bacterium]